MVTLSAVAILLLLISALDFYRKQNKKGSVGAAISLITCIFLATIRDNQELADYPRYKEVFDYIDWNAVIGRSYRSYEVMSSEPLYKLLNFICHSAVNDFHFFLFVEALIVNILIIVFVKDLVESRRKYCQTDYIRCYSLFLAMFYCLGLTNVAIVRQSVSVMICLYSLRHIRHKKFIGFLICTVIAFLFHRASILWILAYFIYHIHTKNEGRYALYLMTLFVGTIAAVILVPRLSQIIPGIAGAKLQSYLATGIDSFGSGQSVAITLAKTIANLIFVLFLAIYMLKLYSNDVNYRGYFNIYIFSVAITLASPFLTNQLARLATPFAMIHTAIIYYFLSSKFVNQASRMLFYILVCAYFLMRFFFSVNIDGYSTIFGMLM